LLKAPSTLRVQRAIRTKRNTPTLQGLRSHVIIFEHEHEREAQRRRFQSSNKTDKSRPNENKDGGKVMKILNAKVVESRKEEPGTEPDRRADTWLIEGKLEQDLMGWENMKIDVPAPEVGAEIVETTMADAKRFTIRTRGEPKVHKGSRLAVTVREAQTA
jgi:hypothetical protein